MKKKKIWKYFIRRFISFIIYLTFCVYQKNKQKNK